MTRWQEAWGRLFWLLAFVLSFVALLRQPHSGHYDIFSQSARLLWAGQNPHGISYPSGPWFYSPACGLFYFGLFAWLPDRWGLALYILSSWAVLTAGLIALFRAFPLRAHLRELFWFLLSSELIGAVLNARVELMMTGCVLLAVAWLVEGQHVGWAACLLAMIVNWKFSPLPIAGLLGVVAIRAGYPRRRFVPIFLGSLALWTLAPLLVLRWDPLMEIHRTWSATLTRFTLENDNWLSFQHLFVLGRALTGFTMSWKGARLTSLLVGLGLAVYFARCRMRDRRETLLYAAALGAAFSLAFSPLSQSAAFIGYAPLLFAGFLQWEMTPEPRGRIYWRAVIWISWALVSLAYSDLVPRALRLVLVASAVKSLGVLVLATALLYWHLRRKPYVEVAR
ncbi:MAG: DUF2029 domain-containing protein [Bdellovibrionales bacterium]|nr:DUF2029 domain-containing protein [Bdellovibrionales bacterium]